MLLLEALVSLSVQTDGCHMFLKSESQSALYVRKDLLGALKVKTSNI